MKKRLVLSLFGLFLGVCAITIPGMTAEAVPTQGCEEQKWDTCITDTECRVDERPTCGYSC